MDKIKPSGIFIPEDLDLSDVPDINAAEWDHIYDDSPEEDEDEPLIAAVSCPSATSDIKLNLENRENAIKAAEYGPLNPKEPNDEFWQDKADRWSLPVEEAKKSICGNCVFFIRTPSMLDCIASGIESGDSSSKNAWDAIDTAELGYCEAFDFKCAASRTCNAWVVGGPITEEGNE
jgi:hypothetical protein